MIEHERWVHEYVDGSYSVVSDDLRSLVAKMAERIDQGYRHVPTIGMLCSLTDAERALLTALIGGDA